MGHQHSDEQRDRFLYAGKLVRIIDGDTVDVSLDLGFKIFYEVRLRLLGIDTPEIRGIEKVAGKVSKDALIELLRKWTRNELFVETEKTGKYGRYLATIWLPVDHSDTENILDSSYVETFNGKDWINVNEYMVFHKFAKRYGE